MSFDRLREEVFRVNQAIVDAGLVVLTWGNASGVDREQGVMAIKPSGVAYASMSAKDIVVLSIETGEVLEGGLNPSSDTPTHLVIYRNFPGVGGVVHTHSTYATSWAQGGLDLPCLGTTHADHFYGAVPVTRLLTDQELTAYEQKTGEVVVECFHNRGLDPLSVPAVLLPHHGPFAWGPDPEHALQNAVALEQVAKMAMLTYSINPKAGHIPTNLLEKHYLRKHGEDAYYGQPRKSQKGR
ncbi:MAG TPA: L-ribulose-5-phosphate 4-epimerase AraD [Spirochaetia bacterium]|nr:L-ribulose-5-phosphate 4-epimerase AraD [Spirochaetia bacterium]